MSKKTISERIWAKLHDHHGDLDDDFECIAHDAEACEKQVELKNTNCNCSEKETTGYITYWLCNNCGKNVLNRDRFRDPG